MATRSVQAKRYDGGVGRDVDDELTVEDVLQVNINGEPFTVTMRTPGHDAELVRGLLFTEHVFDGEAADYSYSEVKDEAADRVLYVNVEIDSGQLTQDVILSRSLLSTSSCGLCGKKEMEEMGMRGEPLAPTQPMDVMRVAGMQAAMREQQATFSRSGGSHAAAAFTVEGIMLDVFEDIGRHNAVDKVVGALLISNRLDDAECLLVSGRVSYEIVMKTYAARIPFIVAVSAPSSLAVKVADQLGISLLGFCRDDRATVYSRLDNVGSCLSRLEKGP